MGITNDLREDTMNGFDGDVIGSLFDAASTASSSLTNTKTESESFSLDDATGFLMRSSFNEAEGDEIDWGVGEEPEADDTEEVEAEVKEDDEEVEVSEDNAEDVSDDEPETDDAEISEGETLGAYEAIKEELDAERETLSGVYERFFKEVVEPLFRKLEDSNINVAFDTTALLSSGIIRIELSHRNSDASAEMEINIFANTVNGEFLGMENTDGEAVATSLEDVSLEDLIGILIKVLG